ncbi:MAG: ABC transporter permease [Pirellulales bacterium]|nr:ABC transporter permease [Pirellulales bacterium]
MTTRLSVLPVLRNVWQRILSVLSAMIRAVEGVGEGALTAWRAATYVLSVIAMAVLLGLRPSSWPRTVRQVMARQILFTGVDAVGFTMRIAAAVGVVVVVQTELWIRSVGDTDLPGPLLLKVIVRELAPLLANFIVIVRSATAISTELATMKLSGEVDVLDSQGLDPLKYLVMPRVLGVSLSVFCLSVIFVAVCFVSGYVVGALIGAITGGPAAFFGSFFRAVAAEELIFFLPKTLVAGLFTGAIASIEGLSVRGATTEVPQAAGRGAVRSLTTVFMVSAVLSLLIYGRLLIFQVI